MRSRSILALANLLSVGHFYLVTYILGPYLATILPDAFTGLVIAAGAIVTLSLFPHVPRILDAVGARRLAVGVAVVQAILLLLLAASPTPVVALLLVALACALSPFISYALDILLEATVEDEGGTGKVRTAFLTAGNVPLLIAPVAIALILDGGNAYQNVFAIASLSLIPFLLLMSLVRLPEGRPRKNDGLFAALQSALRDRDLSAILASNFILQVFYHLAPLYVSLYLHEVLGIPWDTLGWMFAIMLVPFVLIEYPAGALGDKRGDRGLLGLGFACMGIAFALIALLSPATPLMAILLVLVATRIGAALVEAMTEGHFFRHVTEQDATTVEVFRMMRPIAALLSPVLGSIILYLGGYASLFGVTGIGIAVLGLVTSLRVIDARAPEAKTVPPEALSSRL